MRVPAWRVKITFDGETCYMMRSSDGRLSLGGELDAEYYLSKPDGRKSHVTSIALDEAIDCWGPEGAIVQLEEFDAAFRLEEEARRLLKEVNHLRGLAALAELEWTKERGPGAGPVPGIPEWGELTALEASETQARLRRGQSVTRRNAKGTLAVCLTPRWSPESVGANSETADHFRVYRGGIRLPIFVEVMDLTK